MAQADLVSRYGDLSQACLNIDGNLNGVTLQPGVYCVGAAASNLTTTLTLTGSGRHILRFDSTFITSTGSRIAIANGASCGNVAYQVGSSATIGGALFGNIIALTAITMNPGSDVRGRALARNAVLHRYGHGTHGDSDQGRRACPSG